MSTTQRPTPTQSSKAIDIQFQQDIQRLNLLSGNEDTLEAFTKEYERILTENYNSMMQCRNVDKLLEGIYRHRAEILKAMLQRQLDHFGLEWPDTTRKAASGR
jgi:hypothetical protein